MLRARFEELLEGDSPLAKGDLLLSYIPDLISFPSFSDIIIARQTARENLEMLHRVVLENLQITKDLETGKQIAIWRVLRTVDEACSGGE